MNRMQHRVWIQRAPAEVLAYASTPGLWPEWHPASLRLEAGAERPLRRGERFEEDIRTAGRDDHLSWVVEESEPGVRWVARAQSRNNGASIRVGYRVAPSEGGTEFTRDLEYQLPKLWLRLVNVLLLKRRIDAESKLSLQQLKQRLESGGKA